MNTSKKYRILLTSNEPWSDLWFSKHHYANELSKMGHEVYFLDAPTNWSLSNLWSGRVLCRKIKENLCVVQYCNTFPIRLAKKTSLRLNDKINQHHILKALPASDLPILWWKFDPFRFAYLNKKHEGKVVQSIYHITDPFDHIFSDKLHPRHDNLVVTVLDRYTDYYEKLHQQSVLYIPHGISSEEFSIDTTENLKYQRFKNSILKIGTLNDHYNISLLIDVAHTFKEYNLVLVGPNKLTIASKIAQFKKLTALPNVIFEGTKKATELKYYIHNAAVCLVPYDFNIESIKGTPLKVLNYLAQGKVSITSISTGLKHLLGKGLVHCDNSDTFIDRIKDVLSGNIEVDSAYIHTFLESVSYPVLIKKIFNELDKRK